MMQNIIHVLARGMAIIERADIALDKPKITPLRWRDLPTDFVKIGAMSGKKVVEPDHFLPELKQQLKQIRADETGRTGNQPGRRLRRQHRLNFINARHDQAPPFRCRSKNAMNKSNACCWIGSG